MSGAWTRFKQSTRETFKNTKDDLTEIPNDVNTLLLKADGVSQLYSEIINKAQVRSLTRCCAMERPSI